MSFRKISFGLLCACLLASNASASVERFCSSARTADGRSDEGWFGSLICWYHVVPSCEHGRVRNLRTDFFSDGTCRALYQCCDVFPYSEVSEDPAVLESLPAAN